MAKFKWKNIKEAKYKNIMQDEKKNFKHKTILLITS
jgi:hypothetical protein